jgi:drug/metabolite transporter (DMT)-like permease
MTYLLLSVACSVLVSVLLKLAPRWRVDLGQAVTANYLVAAGLTAWLLQPPLQGLRAPGAPWGALLALAVLLPAGFLVLGRAVALAGIVRSDAAQRLSLLLSLLAAFALFGERAHGWKLAGLATGLVAMAGILARPRAPLEREAWHRAWPWLLATWIGFALVDVMLKRIALSGTSAMAALLAAFAIAFVLMLAVQGLRWARGQARPQARGLGAGLLLGALNFGNILFYVRAHQALPDSPAVVFATMNIGVVALGTLAGVLGFGERTSPLNRAGLALAVAAIAMIAWGARG